jgi:DNA-binding NtrC family response regulator
MPSEVVSREVETIISKGRVLVIDDEPAIRESLHALLTLEGGYSVDLAEGGVEGLQKLARRGYDLVLLDLMMPDMSGMEVLHDLRERDRETPIFMITAYGSVQAAVDALKAGADDYFPKPFENDKLIREIEGVIARRRLEHENTHLKRALKQRYSFPNIIGKSDKMLRVLDLVGQVASSRATILITGETGTGKELLARALHYGGPRAAAPFVELNCAALPAQLLESELFGHERGAFTDAKTAKPGLFEVAHGGTMFLDEVDHLAPELQGKLLRALDQKSVRRLGATNIRTIDVRIVAATNTDLPAAVRAGRFREDLFYRLNVITLEIPPLRQRGDDVILLAEFFLRKFGAQYKLPPLSLTPDVQRALLAHAWPGNIRELRNAIERAVLLSAPGTLALTELAHRASPPPGAGPLPFPAPLAQIQRAAARAMLDAAGGNRSEAARRLGISRSRLQRLLEGQAEADDEDAGTN